MPSIFPDSREALNTYLTPIPSYIHDNATRLKIEPLKVETLETAIGDDSTPGSYLYLYSNGPINTRIVPKP